MLFSVVQTISNPGHFNWLRLIRSRLTTHHRHANLTQSMKSKGGETERIQCRADAFHVRRMDERLAARLDPEFKTRSDIMQDAIAMWLEDWDRRYPDGSGGQLRYQSELANMERRRQHRRGFLGNAECATRRSQGRGRYKRTHDVPWHHAQGPW